ncbi:MAG: sigma-70 family RNA polymerase sigma factor [Crocinitomicaceae bacterium]|nr:sigma-70 family RNA polymerase sigma factor [Crocinitomicaceae bacterium]
MTEKELIEGLKQGEKFAFDLLVSTYSSFIYKICYSIVLRKEDAEDVTQEVFTKLYLNIHTFNEQAKLSTWMYRIALNQSNEFLRKSARKKRLHLKKTTSDLTSIAGIIPDKELLPDKVLIEKEEFTIIHNAIQQLPENYKVVLLLNSIEGLSYKDLAEKIGYSIPATESLIYRAKQKLKVILTDYYEKNYDK